MVTGSAGYIGSHACLTLLETGHRVVAVDNLARGHRGAIENLSKLDQSNGNLTFVEASIADRDRMAGVLREHEIDVVMHFAAYAYVGESVHEPLRYYENNTGGACELLQAMGDAGTPRFVFSSTCATYGEPPETQIPIRETCPQSPINPYGWSKLMVEHMLRDHAEACRSAGTPFGYAALRYFNVAGSDPGGRIGEDHRPETHLIPICLEVAAGRREALTIFGDDYQTEDGTCIRDYVHVMDLIDAHVAVMNALEACRRVTGHEIPAKLGPRRAGDPPRLFADATKIRETLGWSPNYTDLEETVRTAWRWMKENPTGYPD